VSYRLTVIGSRQSLAVISYQLRVKQSSEAALLDEGQIANEREVIRRQARERRVEGNRANEFAQFFSTLEGPEKIYWRTKSANEEGKKHGKLAAPLNAAVASCSVAQSLVMPNAIAPVRRMSRHSDSG
jgi:hypothetical protein